MEYRYAIPTRLGILQGSAEESVRVSLRLSVYPACPVAPADGTGVEYKANLSGAAN